MKEFNQPKKIDWILSADTITENRIKEFVITKIIDLKKICEKKIIEIQQQQQQRMENVSEKIDKNLIQKQSKKSWKNQTSVKNKNWHTRTTLKMKKIIISGWYERNKQTNCVANIFFRSLYVQ